MRNRIPVVFLLLLITSCFTFCTNHEQKGNQEMAEADTQKVVREQTLQERGKYLVTAMSCGDCHTPKTPTRHGMMPDSSRLLSGSPSDTKLPKIDTTLIKNWVMFNPDLTAAVGPWGISYAANITSDETGIGRWTEDQFFTCIREGKYKGEEGGRSLLPPMPWQSFATLSDADLKAIFYYLKTVKPVRNIPPAPQPLTEISKKKR